MPAICDLKCVALALGAGERRGQGCDRRFEIVGIGALELQHVGQLGDLRVEPAERGVLAEDFLAEEELGQHEQREQEDDDEQQARQGIDEARASSW